MEEIHHNKCSFCETYIRPVDTPQVEHYRPKNTLKDDPTHIGYYWLGHEWNNLLLACLACNKAKSSQFPIQGVRVTTPALLEDSKLDRSRCLPDAPPLSDESPFLINPEYENPEPHFRFHTDGRMEGITVRGKKTIAICKLDRKSLDIDRKKILDTYMASLDEKFVGYAEGILTKEGLAYFLRKTLERIKKNVIPEMKYTLFRKYSYDHFEEFFVNQVEENQKENLRNAFRELS